MLTICINGCQFALHLDLTLLLHSFGFCNTMEMSQSLLHVVDTAWVGHAFGSVAVSGMHGLAAIGLAAIQPGMLFETGYGAPCCLRYGMVHHVFVQTSIYNMHIAISCSIIKTIMLLMIIIVMMIVATWFNLVMSMSPACMCKSAGSCRTPE